MKLAVLADIHANMVALEAVAAHVDAWQPDLVVVAGDIVNRGPRPVETLRFVQQRQRRQGWLVVRGNHEEYVIAQSRPDAPQSGPLFDIFLSSLWTYRQLDCDVTALTAMPFQQEFATPDHSRVRVTHASTRGTRDGIFPTTPDDELRQQIGRPRVQLFCVGHTHWPLIRLLQDTLVVNVGAAGLPFDGDRRASYGQMVWHHGHWHAQIIRVEYDRLRSERDFHDSGFLDQGGPLARLMLIELQTAQSQLYQWAREFEAPVRANQLSLADSVASYLAQS